MLRLAKRNSHRPFAPFAPSRIRESRIRETCPPNTAPELYNMKRRSLLKTSPYTETEKILPGFPLEAARHTQHSKRGDHDPLREGPLLLR